MDFWERLDYLVNLKSNRKKIAATVGIAANTFSTWKKRKSFPTADVLFGIAKALDVSIEYLITGQEPSGLPPRLAALSRELARLPEEDIEEIETLVDLKISRQEKQEAPDEIQQNA